MGGHPQILLGNLGMADSLILMVLALVVFGPRRLPQIGRQIGKLMYEFRKASNDFKFQMEEELRVSEDADRRKKAEEERARNLALNPPAQTVEAQADIGAVEQPSVPALPQPAADAASDTEDADKVAEDPLQHRYPRISPPSTGEPVAAARPNSAPDASGETAANAGANAEPDPAGEPGPPTALPKEPPSSSTHTEAMSQHG
ncbi:MAG TPA: twin-arginine translocase TatA/TatE family subunit [Terracidiphilus sp.]|jgi:sec-independent protein translocase protein TatB